LISFNGPNIILFVKWANSTTMIEEIEDPEAEIEDVEETEEEEGVVEDSEEEEHPKYLSSLIDSQAYSLPVDSKTLL